jgi:peptidoglycan/LPS O-acetylase OafA/YrhL
MFFYALFAIGILFQRPALVSVACILAAILIGSVFANGGAAAQFLANPITLFFVLGVVVARYEAFLPKKPIFVAAGVVLWVLAALLPVAPLAAFATKCLAAPLILLGVLASRGAERSPIRSFFKGLGDASYSIYLVHTIILAMIYKILSKMNWHGYEEFVLLVVVGLAVSIVAGLFSYWFIEKPLMRVFKAVWHRRQELFGVA